MSDVRVPIDIYESAMELVIIMPLGGVVKKSVDLSLQGQTLLIRGERVKPKLKSSLVAYQERCFR